MAVLRDIPYGNYNFLVDVGGGDPAAREAGFAEVVLPQAYVDVIEYRNGNDRQSTARKLPGLAKFTNCTLRRGIIGALDLYQWWDAARNGDPAARRSVVITLRNEDRTATVMTWKLHRAFPVKYAPGPLNAQGSDVAIEVLELACEDLTVE